MTKTRAEVTEDGAKKKRHHTGKGGRSGSSSSKKQKKKRTRTIEDGNNAKEKNPTKEMINERRIEVRPRMLGGTLRQADYKS